mmetsp:Transcript_40207/g.67418  ORF Transcript_40207/g.67418 Transcript_40207/m.67418 type:complete len:229 (-) Transcript_40207:86-772(-)
MSPHHLAGVEAEGVFGGGHVACIFVAVGHVGHGGGRACVEEVARQRTLHRHQQHLLHPLNAASQAHVHLRRQQRVHGHRHRILICLQPLEGVVNVMPPKQPLFFLHHVQERALCLLCLWAVRTDALQKFHVSHLPGPVVGHQLRVDTIYKCRRVGVFGAALYVCAMGGDLPEKEIDPGGAHFLVGDTFIAHPGRDVGVALGGVKKREGPERYVLCRQSVRSRIAYPDP